MAPPDRPLPLACLARLVRLAHRAPRALLVPILLVPLVACGGGSGNGGAVQSPPVLVRVLVLHKGTDANGLNATVGQLQATGFFTVQTFNAGTPLVGGSASPGVAGLSKHDVALVWGDGQLADGALLGTDLATFADAGGGVVVAMFLHRGANPPVPSFPEGLGGTWDALLYSPVPEDVPPLDSPLSCAALPLVSLAPAHPLMAGGALVNVAGTVPALNLAAVTAPVCTHPSGTATTAGATLLARWSDNVPFLTVAEVGPLHARMVALGAHVPQLATSATAFQSLINALLWAANEL